MAKKVTGEVVGGKSGVFDDVDTVGQVADKLGIGGGYTAAINGDTAEYEDEVEDYNNVTFAEASKGGI